VTSNLGPQFFLPMSLALCLALTLLVRPHLADNVPGREPEIQRGGLQNVRDAEEARRVWLRDLAQMAEDFEELARAGLRRK